MFYDSPFVHFGGDEVITAVWNRRPEIKDFMAAHGIKDYDGLQSYYRLREKAIWRKYSSQKIAYWTNEDLHLEVEDDDIIHWWGSSTGFETIEGKPNLVILSNFDSVYLDTGSGNAFANRY